jgi:cation:H+ antiporter
MNNLSILALTVIFIVSAVVTCLAGISLTRTTTTLDSRFKLGDALGGLILLGISGSLPEVAVVTSAAYAGHIDVITGTLLGGIAFQTLIIVIFDFACSKKKSLAGIAGSPMLVAESIFAIVITVFAVFGTCVPANITIFNINPFSIVIVVAWFVGLYLIDRLRKTQPEHTPEVVAVKGRSHKQRRAVDHPAHEDKTTTHVMLIFLLGCVITLIAGYFVEETGTIIASRLNINSGIFAATVIAFVTALPEISTGLESVLLGDNYLAISDIMGGNAFMLVLFILTDLVAKKPILSFAGNNDVIFAGLGIVLMGIYALSFWKKPRKVYFRLGIDSVAAIAIYVVGLILITEVIK